MIASRRKSLLLWVPAIAALAALAPAALADAGLDRVLGRALFERIWVPAPASTDAADGLGPLFNARACTGCHSGGGGARFGSRPDGSVEARGLVLRFGTDDGGADPVYGRQLQDQAVPGLAAEGRLRLAPESGGGLTVVPELHRGPMGERTRSSVRAAPSLRGIGDRERVAEAAILALADPEDRDGGGISGRARIVDTPDGPRVGRFGWKGEGATLSGQVANAFALDLGLSSPAAPHPHGDCTLAEPDCLAAATGESALFDGHEISEEIVDLVAEFLRGLDLPPGRGGDAGGAELFARAGCAACHVPELPDASGRRVRIFTDFLLHDMGDRLDDGMAEGGAASSEWRTPSLAGLAVKDGSRRYLHDASAASVEAAILAHAGEGARARDLFLSMQAADRAALLAYLESL
ncbi:di-heme oxidoredictase family protein [Faunimonas sp. B44]|uniref:di-heme oxidoredictase family protein n=1 Tax=Faunimonas sp. B44 TaxID=3461493 RepID=UPI004044BD7E